MDLYLNCFGATSKTSSYYGKGKMNNLNRHSFVSIEVRIANKDDLKQANEIAIEIENSAQSRGTGIAKRSPQYIKNKILEGKGVIAYVDNMLAGFCYIESWEGKQFVANSGLIVFPSFRRLGLARLIKGKALELSADKFPEAKVFGLTTSLAVMTINYELGYRPVTFEKLTQDDSFWEGCKSCINYPILQSKNRKNCLCTAMLYQSEKHDTESMNSLRKGEKNEESRFSV